MIWFDFTGFDWLCGNAALDLCGTLTYTADLRRDSLRLTPSHATNSLLSRGVQAICFSKKPELIYGFAVKNNENLRKLKT